MKKLLIVIMIAVACCGCGTLGTALKKGAEVMAAEEMTRIAEIAVETKIKGWIFSGATSGSPWGVAGASLLLLGKVSWRRWKEKKLGVENK